jgi:thymidylate synthase
MSPGLATSRTQAVADRVPGSEVSSKTSAYRECLEDDAEKEEKQITVTLKEVTGMVTGYTESVQYSMFDDMLAMRARNAGHAYPKALRLVLENGSRVAPRGMMTKELRPATIQFKKPWECLVAHAGRHLNPFFLMAEVLWMMSGRSDAYFITHYNKNLLQSLDGAEAPNGNVDALQFHGAYGERLRRYGTSRRFAAHGRECVDQVQKIVDKLRADPDTRQAVLAIWNPVYDWFDSRDYPCNNLVYFKIRDGALHMTVTNRSNDLNWGLFSTNVVQFGMLMGLVHACLDDGVLRAGSYTHQTDSLHVYDSHSYAHLAYRPEFPLYDHVSALRFSGIGNTKLTLEDYDGAVSGAIDLLLRARHKSFEGKLTDAWEDADKKPMWKVPLVTDFVNLLLCSEALYRDEYDSILPLYTRATASDWMVMTGEYMYRILTNRAKVGALPVSALNLCHEISKVVEEVCDAECAQYVEEDWWDATTA